MGSGSSQIVGYDYYFGIHMGISRGPLDEICEIKVGDRVVYPRPAKNAGVVFDKLHELATSSLGGSYINALGESEILIVLPFGVSNPPFVPGQRVRLAGFERTYHEFEGPVMGPPLPITVSGDYFIYSIAPFNNEQDGNQLGPAYGDPRLAIRAPASMWAVWTNYVQGYSTPTGDGTATIEAIDWTGDVPAPVPEAYGITENGDHLIDSYDVFGGREGEGGILGWLSVMMGEQNQMPAWGLSNMLGNPPGLSGFRGMCTVFFDGIVAAINPYPKPWAFRVRRTLKGWDGDVWHPELARIVLTRPLGPGDTTLSPEIHAMNPAHIIFECLTNRQWGRGLDRSALDEPSFLATATTLHAEDFGLCLRWSRRDTIGEFIKSVLEHIGGVMYSDRTTAKIRLELIRGGYDFAALPMLDAESGLLSIGEGAVGAVPSLVNEIEVSYVDPITGQDQSVRVHNLASLQASGGQFNSLHKDYPGIATPDLARRVAQRDLRAYGVDLRKFTLTCDRRAWNITPGSVIKIQDIARGIPPMAVRVGPTKDGTLVDGKITINAVQDAFALPATSFLGNQLPQWTPPNNNPCVGRHKVFEMPYLLAARLLTPAQFAAVTPEAARVAAVVEQGRPLNNSFEIAVRNGASTSDDIPTSNAHFCGYEFPEA